MMTMQSSMVMVRDLPAHKRPTTRLREVGPAALSTMELAACLLRADEHVLREVAEIGPSQAVWLLVPVIGRQEQECFVVLYLDMRNRVVDREILYQGTLNTSLVRIAEVFRGAIRRNCASMIVVHNHLSGDSSPSPEYVALTRKLVGAGELMDMQVLDYVVVGATRYRRMWEAWLGWL